SAAKKAASDALTAKHNSDEASDRAIKNEHKAVAQEAKARDTSAQADFDIALMYQHNADLVDPRVLAHLARALRTWGSARLPRQYIVSLLRDLDWYVPATEPVRHEGTVRTSFSRDCQRVLTVSEDEDTAQVWDVGNNKPLGEAMQTGVVSAASFSPDGRRVAIAAGWTAQVWDTESGEVVSEPISQRPGIEAVSFSPSGRRIVIVSDDKTARVWNAGSGKPVSEPMSHED